MIGWQSLFRVEDNVPNLPKLSQTSVTKLSHKTQSDVVSPSFPVVH